MDSVLCEEGLTFGGSSISTGYAGKVDGEVSKEEISVPLAMAGVTDVRTAAQASDVDDDAVRPNASMKYPCEGTPRTAKF